MFDHLKKNIDISNYNIITDPIRQKIDKNKPLIYWCHDMPSDPRYNLLDKNAFFVFVSEFQKQLFQKNHSLPNNKCFVIHNAIDIDEKKIININ